LPHPARFPVQLPTFFLRFLTDPDDLVLAPFAGSNTTGEACEREGRRWIAVETEERYLEASRFRFAGDLQALPDLYESADDGESVVVQGSLFG
jgi:DNA modification methylase